MSSSKTTKDEPDRNSKKLCLMDEKDDDSQHSADLMDSVYSPFSSEDESMDISESSQSDHEKQNNLDLDENSCIMDKVIKNNSLVKLIFNCLPRKTIFVCRLISRKWNEAATEYLKDDFEIEFQHYFQDSFFISKTNKKSLAQLTNIIESSKNFPCVKFLFTGGDLGNEAAQRFFKYYGKFIKSLKLYHYNPKSKRNLLTEFRSSFKITLDNEEEDDERKKEIVMRKWTDSRILNEILTELAYNIESLEVAFPRNNFWPGYDNLLFGPAEEKDMTMTLSMTKLKSIHIWVPRYYSQRAITCQLLKLAVNLSCLKFNDDEDDPAPSDPLWFWSILFHGNKMNLLKELVFNPFGQVNIEDYKVLASYEPKLEYLELKIVDDVDADVENWKDILDTLLRILWSSQKSLKKIDSFSKIELFPCSALSYPIFENFTEIELSPNKNIEETTHMQGNFYAFSLLPRGLSFSKNLPHLHTVILKFPCEIKEEAEMSSWIKYFPFSATTHNDPATSVRNLILDFKSFPLIWLHSLMVLFPCVENFTVGFLPFFEKAATIIWESQWKLKYLKLRSDFSNYTFDKLDSIFTGFSPEDCEILRYSRCGFTPKEIKENRENSSIVNLKDLEKLVIALNYSWECFRISKVTGIYAFEQMKKLKEVGVSLWSPADPHEVSYMKQKLEPLAAYKVKLIR